MEAQNQKNIIPEKLRQRLHTIIHESDTRAGKTFDIVLQSIILLSVIAVMLESIESVRIVYGHQLMIVEWVVTVLFTLEYIGRLIAVNKPLKYALSFYGIIDLLAMLPMYIAQLFPATRFLIAIRAVRFLRIFRILKLPQFVGASNQLTGAIAKSRTKIAVFLFSVMVLCTILGTLMYMIEGPEHGFTSIPISIYWTIVTLTTVGFGDITPITPLGQFVSVIIMFMGYGIIAVPTGLVTAQIINDHKVDLNTQVCPNCHATNHRDEAKFCYNCGSEINPHNNAA
ncbi:MAG: ion transporter [Bacteroidia bacterium]